MNYSSEFLFGIPVESLFPENDVTEIDKLSNLLNFCLAVMSKRLRLGIFRFTRGWDFEWRNAVAQFHALIESFIAKAAEKDRTSTRMKDTQPCILVDELLSLTDSLAEVYGPLMNVYLPARDAAAIGVSNILFFLARHPPAWAKVRAEVLANAPTGHITYELLKSMKYLQYTISEG